MSLLRMSLSGAVLILAIVVIRAVAMDRLPKKMLLAFWSVAILRLLLPVSFPSVPTVFTPARAGAPVLDTVENGITTFAAGVLSSPQIGTGTGNGTAQMAEKAGPMPSPLFLLWITGALLLAGYFLISYLRCRLEFRTSLPVRNEFAEQWLSAHPLRRRMEIRSLTGISAPLTYGLLRPVILMPKATDWSDDRPLQYILYHEYLHIRRFDAVRKLLAAATVCIHWFNPAVWVLFYLYNRDMELVCDEGVLRFFGEKDRAAYARTLVDAAQQRYRFGLLYNSFAKNAVEERIKAIMRFRKTTVLALAAAAVVIVIGLVAAFTVAPRAANADFGEILLGNVEFLYVSDGTAQPKTISDVPALFDPYDDYMKIWYFAIQDLDGDGGDEVVLSVQGISGDTGGSLIFHKSGGKVYGYPISNRDFFRLKTDGRFEYTEPAGFFGNAAFFENGVAAIDGFTKTGYTVDKITYIRLTASDIDIDQTEASTDDPIVVEHQPADAEGFIAAIAAHNQKPDAVWYDFTEKNIKSVF